MIETRRRQLQDALLLFEPQRLVGSIQNVRDIFNYRHVLKRAPFDPRTARHIAYLIQDALTARARFRVFDSLKVLRAVVIAGDGERLPAPTIKMLFEIYKQLIPESREEMQWCLSRIIKDLALDDNAVMWLVDHWSDSMHIVNRLLRYPKPHSRIIEWSRARYHAGDLLNRRSELIAVLLSSEDIDSFLNEAPEVLGWAVVQSRLARTSKIRHLSFLADVLPADALVTFAIRLNAPVILRRALKSATKHRREA